MPGFLKEKKYECSHRGIHGKEKTPSMDFLDDGVTLERDDFAIVEVMLWAIKHAKLKMYSRRRVPKTNVNTSFH